MPGTMLDIGPDKSKSNMIPALLQCIVWMGYPGGCQSNSHTNECQTEDPPEDSEERSSVF